MECVKHFRRNLNYFSRISSYLLVDGVRECCEKCSWTACLSHPFTLHTVSCTLCSHSLHIYFCLLQSQNVFLWSSINHSRKYSPSKCSISVTRVNFIAEYYILLSRHLRDAEHNGKPDDTSVLHGAHYNNFNCAWGSLATNKFQVKKLYSLFAFLKWMWISEVRRVMTRRAVRGRRKQKENLCINSLLLIVKNRRSNSLITIHPHERMEIKIYDKSIFLIVPDDGDNVFEM